VLLLFDVDGTLVSGATDAHRDALYEAMTGVHGIDREILDRPVVEPAGRTDPEIARIILLDAGVPAELIDERAEELRERACIAYARLCPNDLSHTVIPGIPELLAWLAGQRGVELGLLTGNYEPVARLKLARAGLGKWFPSAQGAFGSDSEDRAALPEIARRRAGTNGHPYPRAKTVVIGDTPRDIACARADGVGCIAIATGTHAADELRGADAVVGDAAGLRDALEARL
jgi:phosphoglycolate phosphatase